MLYEIIINYQNILIFTLSTFLVPIYIRHRQKVADIKFVVRTAVYIINQLFDTRNFLRQTVARVDTLILDLRIGTEKSGFDVSTTNISVFKIKYPFEKVLSGKTGSTYLTFHMDEVTRFVHGLNASLDDLPII